MAMFITPVHCSLECFCPGQILLVLFVIFSVQLVAVVSEILLGFKTQYSAWWHMPVISAIWEAEAEGSQVRDLPSQLNETLSQNKVKAGHSDSCL
jgi:hypothetical protein